MIDRQKYRNIFLLHIKAFTNFKNELNTVFSLFINIFTKHAIFFTK